MAQVIVVKFTKENRYVIYPLLEVKNSGAFAVPPYITGYDFTGEELLSKILYALQFSTEGPPLGLNPKTRLAEFLKNMGVKTMKALHTNTIQMDGYVKDGIIEFSPWENKGSKDGFRGMGKESKVFLPIDSPKEELIKAVELTLSRCK